MQNTLTVSEALRLRPRIGIAGSFGRGNFGDELFVRVYEQQFGDWSDLYMLAGLPRQPYFRSYGNAAVDITDAVVLGGGDLLVPARQTVDRDFVNPMYLRRSVHVCGVGVQANSSAEEPAMLRAWQSFLGHSNVKSITARDPGSQEWIASHFELGQPVGVHPDLVCALELPTASQPGGAPIVGIVTRSVVDPSAYAPVARIAEELITRGWRVRHIIGGVGPHGKKDYENAAGLNVPGKEVVYTEDLDEICRAIGECSLVLSYKLHTTLVSAMYGVPTISVSPVFKQRAFMEALGLGANVIPAKEERRIMAAIDAGVPVPEPGRVALIREQAASALRDLGQRIWDDFRSASPERQQLLSAEMPRRR
ncbi:polysaccharide pyruvyl transferase family protein [Microbacterium aurum]